MKSDLIKLLTFIWLCGTVFILYEIWANISYIANLLESYMQMALGNIRK